MSQLLLQFGHGQRQKLAGQFHTRLQHMQAGDAVVIAQ